MFGSENKFCFAAIPEQQLTERQLIATFQAIEEICMIGSCETNRISNRYSINDVDIVEIIITCER